MARIRSIKPSFWVSEQIAECSTNARLTFIGLWNFSDDGGVHPARPKTLKAELYPMDDVSASDVAAWMRELIDVGLVIQFRADDGAEYWSITGWDKHQKIDRPSRQYPSPTASDSTNARRTLVEPNDESSSNDQGKNSEDSSDATPRIGRDRKGEAFDESSNAASALLKSKTKSDRKPAETLMADDFAVSPRVRAWAGAKGFERLDDHLEHFRLTSKAKAYRYADWDAAFMKAITDDWAKLRDPTRSKTAAANGVEALFARGAA